MGEDEENFDPQRYWAEVNHERQRVPIGIKDREKLEELIQCCRLFRSRKEILTELRITEAKLTQILEFARHARGLQLERTETPQGMLYRCKDARTRKQ